MLNFYQNKEQAKKYLAEADKVLPKISSIARGKEIIIASDKHKEIFLVPKEMLHIFNKIRGKGRLLFLGEFFSTIDKGFKPSFNSIAKYAKMIGKRMVIVNQKGEQTFLYGFNLERKFILSFDRSIKIDDYVVVCNESNEALGLGRIIFDLKNSKSEQKVVKNISDLGWYLRHKEGLE